MKTNVNYLLCLPSAILIVLLGCTGEAWGDLITFSYSGSVDKDLSGGSRDDEPFKAFADQMILVTYTFDSNTLDTNDSSVATYRAITDLTITLGENTYTGSNGRITISANDTTNDVYQVNADLMGPAVGGIGDQDGETIELILTLSDSTSSALTTDALPVVQPDPIDFDPPGDTRPNAIRLDFTGAPESGGGDGGGRPSGSIVTNGVAIAVPEPNSGFIIAAATILLGVFRRRPR